MSLISSIFAFFRFNQKNWKAVVLSVFAATVFWCFNALNKNYSTNISYPIEFRYDETKYVEVDPLPTQVRLNVNGQGWDLFRKTVRLKIPPLIIPLEKPADTKKIVGSTLPALFSSQSENTMKINFVLTDTLFVNLDYRASRRVKVSVDSVMKFVAGGHGLASDISIKPDSVEVDGPRQLVKALPATIHLTLPKGISESFDEEVLVLPEYAQKLTVIPGEVKVSFQVDELMEIQDMIPLNFINSPAKLSTSSLAKKVTIIYHLPESLVQQLPGDSLYAELDLSRLGRGTHKLVPHVVGLPERALLTRVDSVLVSF